MGRYTRYHEVRKGCRLSWLTNSALVCEPKCRGRVELRGLSQWVHLYTWNPNKFWRSNSIFKLYTAKKENRIFLTYKEILSGPVAKSYMRKGGFLIYEEMRKYFPIYEEAVSHIWLCNCFILNFLIYDENFILFFISVVASILRPKNSQLKELSARLKEMWDLPMFLLTATVSCRVCLYQQACRQTIS